jgi:hypothetical protein
MREDFIRIAMAQLIVKYKYKPQRLAMAALMYRKWIERQANK